METVRRSGISEEREIDSERISLGRGDDQDIRLQTRLAGLNHAVIEQGSDGVLRIRAIAPNRILHNGRKLAEAILKPGDEFGIGAVRFTVLEVREGYNLRLQLKEPTGRQSKELEDALLARTKSDSWVRGFSMRRTAWILSLAILILFLLTPLAGFVYKPLGGWLRSLPLASDLSWNSGAIAPVHSFFANDCNRCHEKAFVSVRNSACTACHENTPHHLAEGFKNLDSFEPDRCVSCHKEHNGAGALVRHDEGLCTACHENIKDTAPDSTLADVSGFGKGHPEFKASLARFTGGKQDVARIPLDQKQLLREQSNFEFSHAAHLDKAGVKTPERGKVQLGCPDCHRPEPGGKHMAKLDFESQCHECHRLNFEVDDPKKELPHGDDKTVKAFLEGYYADRALKGGFAQLSAPAVVQERQRPGETLAPREQLAIREWVVKNASDVNAEAMRYRVCGKCHIVDISLGENSLNTPLQSMAQPWKVAPLNLLAKRFPKADFDHGKHKTQECKDCHDAEKSKNSDEVLLKGIATCRECHGGVDAKGKVASTCIDCHGFHVSADLSMDGKKIAPPVRKDSVPGINPPLTGNAIPGVGVP